MTLHHILHQGKALPRLALTIGLAVLLLGAPGRAWAAEEITHGLNPCVTLNHAFSLLDQFQGIAAETQKLANHIHDGCGKKILLAALQGDIKGMKQGFSCQTNDPCVLKAAIDLAYHESKDLLSSPMNPDVLYAVADQESTFQQFRDKEPIRHLKAIGFMQVEPASAKQYADVTKKEIEQNPYKNALAGVKIFINYRNKLQQECGFSGYMLDLMAYMTYNGGPKYARKFCHRTTVPKGGDLGDHVAKFQDKLEQRRYVDTLSGCPNIPPNNSNRPVNELAVEYPL